MFAVAEDAGFSYAAFSPCFVAGAFVEEGFAKDKEFGAEGAHYFLRGWWRLWVGVVWVCFELIRAHEREKRKDKSAINRFYNYPN